MAKSDSMDLLLRNWKIDEDKFCASIQMWCEYIVDVLMETGAKERKKERKERREQNRRMENCEQNETAGVFAFLLS